MLKALSPDGTSIAYAKSGCGPALLLVHGAGGTRSRWDRLLPALNASFTTYVMDRRGRADSGDGPSYSIEREFEDVSAVVDAIGESVFLFGHSLGAVCALGAALRNHNISKLVLYEPPLAMPLPRELVTALDDLLQARALEALLETFLRDVARVPSEDIEAMRSGQSWPMRVAAAHTLLREVDFEAHWSFDAADFGQLETPTLLLLGSESAESYVRATERVQQALPNSRVETLPGQRHSAMDTAPDLFVRSLRDFLLRAGPKTSDGANS